MIREELDGPCCMSRYRAMWHTLRSEQPQTNTDGTMESNTKSTFAENHLFETSDNIVQKIRLLDQKSNCEAIMRGDRQNHTRSPCRPVTHLLFHGRHLHPSLT